MAENLDLEKTIVTSVHSAIVAAIKQRLESHNSPLDGYIKASLEKHAGSVRDLLDGAIGTALSGDFAAALADACTRKLAKVLVSKMEGEIEKRVGELRQSPEFRSRLTVAIDDVVRSMSAPAITDVRAARQSPEFRDLTAAIGNLVKSGTT